MFSLETTLRNPQIVILGLNFFVFDSCIFENYEQYNPFETSGNFVANQLAVRLQKKLSNILCGTEYAPRMGLDFFTRKKENKQSIHNF